MEANRLEELIVEIHGTVSKLSSDMSWMKEDQKRRNGEFEIHKKEDKEMHDKVMIIYNGGKIIGGLVMFLATSGILIFIIQRFI